MTRNIEQVYLVHTDSIAAHADNFQIRRNFERNNIVHLGGWFTFSPIEIRKREQLGITDIKEAFYKKGNVYVLSKAGMDMVYIENCLKKEYGTCHSKLLDTISFRDYFYTIEKFEE